MAKVKICGISHEIEIGIMNELRPDYIGFVFVPRSKRFIAPEHAGHLRAKLNPAIKTIGVFSNASLNTVAMCVETSGIDFIQLHGDETREYIASLRELIHCPIIKAFKVKRAIDAERAMNTPADYVMLDSGEGSGKTFDWSLIGNTSRRYFLAGGLTPENVQQALSITPQPYCLDVSTGVESNRLKDYRKVMKFILAVREFKKKNAI
ncbi:MAG: phosphoribosylanthranilate isomerase [Synergistaceae bacterium]|nr:phosphoribosylanthranilate isomerase [Synergistaceae bacterium]MBQ3448985.1 phosphoribosylanthranilate isomerase [Synergistaceae bacterium]MBQ3694529.1 phosphoribosylanthranilate isomerase [Synergistaceae bacterium]MBQ9629296.1 phosphoribosylanthranilate isomerase [Synergistaceae bacterium]MBR0068864.1 phosphoribosylanthranilate isomerase [Synergistaceae bacterium]